MYPSQSPPPNDQFRERDVAPLVPEEWPTAEEAWSGGPRDLDAASDQRIGKRPVAASIRSGRRSNLAVKRPSIGRQMFRTLARFFVTVLVGVGATLAWQSYGDEAKETVTTWAPSLGWLLLSVPTTRSPAAAATPGELVQQLEPIARDLAVVRRSLEQLAAKQEELAARQEQMGHNIATLQAVEQGIRQRTTSSPPPSRAVPGQPSRPPQQPTAQSAPPAPPPVGPSFLGR